MKQIKFLAIFALFGLLFACPSVPSDGEKSDAQSSPSSVSSAVSSVSSEVSSESSAASSVSSAQQGVVEIGLIDWTNMAPGARVDRWGETTVTTNTLEGYFSYVVPSGGGCKIYPGITDWTPFLSNGSLVLRLRAPAGSNQIYLQPEAPNGGYLGWKSITEYGMTNDDTWHIVTVPISYLFSGNEEKITNVQGIHFDGNKPLVFDVDYVYITYSSNQ